MKRILAKQSHYKSLINTIRRHPEFAEGKAQLQRMVAELESREKRMSEILSDKILNNSRSILLMGSEVLTIAFFLGLLVSFSSVITVVFRISR